MSTDGPRARLAAGLREVRDRSGQTLRELQEATYASDSSLSRYLSGRSVPPWKVVVALCKQGGTDPAALRPLWQQARADRNKRPARTEPARPEPARPEPARPEPDLAEHLAAISDEVSKAIRSVRERGDAVPEYLRTVAARIRSARQLLRP